MSSTPTVSVAPLTHGETLSDLAALAHQYLRTRVRKGEIGTVTARQQRPILFAFAATYGDRPVSKLSKRHINKWLEARSHLKASTRRNQLSIVRAFTAWLVEERHITVDPMRGVKSPRQPRTAPRAMPAGDVGRLLRTAPDARGRAIVSLAVGCGLRCVEIARLHVEDWDRQNDIVRVVGKGGHERDLPVPDMVRRHLIAYLVEHPATVGPMMRSFRDGHSPLKPQTISLLFNEWLREAGVKLSPYDGVSAHALRHTFASDVLERSADLRVVQEALGHRNLSTTSIYLRRAGIPKLREAMEGREYQELIPSTEPLEEP